MAKAYTILSLDLGSNVGWCFIKAGLITQSGVLDLRCKESHPGYRFLKFQNMISPFRHVSEIFYEDVPRFESAGAARVYCGLLSILQVFCLMNKIRLTNIKAGSVKKEFAGHGHAKKPDMCRTAHRLGWRHGHPETDIDHDEADAIAAAWVLMQRRGVKLEFQVE